MKPSDLNFLTLCIFSAALMVAIDSALLLTINAAVWFVIVLIDLWENR